MKITLTNRIAVLMRERQINSASEFGRRMTAAGFPISSSHASRYEKDSAPAFDLKFINAACNVLQCLPSDLYNITIELEEDESLDPTLALPRQAIVLRAERTHEPGTALQAEPLIPQAQAAQLIRERTKAPKTTGKVTLKPVVDADEDTGPSGVLFPYFKPKN
jgi:DNA-binding Xre family transcriptional regulator